MASGDKNVSPPKGKYYEIVTDPEGIYAPTPGMVMWKTTSLFDHNGVEVFKNVMVPAPLRFIPKRTGIIGDLSKKIHDTKEAEAEIARQKTQEEEKHKACVQRYEDRIHKLEEQLDKISLDIKKKDADNKSAGIVQPQRTKYLDAKNQREFMKRFQDYQLAEPDNSYNIFGMKDPKEKEQIEMENKFRAARAAGKIKLGPGVRFVPDPPTQPQKRKIDEVYNHDSDEDDLVILGEWPCEKKGGAGGKKQENRVKMYNEDDPLGESIVEKWMKTWDQFFHHGPPK